MAWFGDKFGDSLNSLKGQITKITKEVLAENDNDSGDESEQSVQERLKELAALCESKDLEILSLREENLKLTSQYQAEIEFLRNENKRLRRNGEISNKNFEPIDDQIQLICELENQLSQCKVEKEQLLESLEELQNEHQNNLKEVVKIGDGYKEQLEKLTNDFMKLKAETDNASDFQDIQDQYELSLKEIQSRDEEISMLKDEIGRLSFKIEIDQKEKEESFQTIKKEIVNHENLKTKLEKLVDEISGLREEKQKIDVENKKLKVENESLKNDSASKIIEISNLTKKFEEMESNLNSLNKKNLALLSKIENDDVNSKMSNLMSFEKEAETKLRHLLRALNLNETEDDSSQKLLNNSVNLIESKWSELLREKDNMEASFNHMIKMLEEEIQKLKIENQSLENELLKCQEEIGNLEATCAELKNQQQDCMIQSQTDDDKRLEQEVMRLTELLDFKTQQLRESVESKNQLEKELIIMKSVAAKRENELMSEKKSLEEEVTLWKNTIQTKENQFSSLYSEKMESEKKLSLVENQISELEKLNNELKNKLQEINENLSTENNEILTRNSNLEKLNEELKNDKIRLENQLEEIKAQVIVKDSSLIEIKEQNRIILEDSNKLKLGYEELEAEVKKWKDTSVDLEMQREDLTERKESLETELARAKQELQNTLVKDSEIVRLQQELANLGEMYNQLYYQYQLLQNQLKPVEVMSQASQENLTDLNAQNPALEVKVSNEGLHPVQQHRRTKSANDFDTSCKSDFDIHAKSDSADAELEKLRNCLRQEQTKYKSLQNEHQELKEKEGNLRKELERLRLHLVEVEDHYTSEAVENEKTINDFKSKLINAEEQLKNSSTIYKSANVRANQHLESLQSQIRLITFQRDDLQSKLSAAEDEVQKHAASLTSLQLVLEQFQQDKERQIEGIVTKYDYQLQLSQKRFQELETEIESLKKQLAEAKNGLNAASRLGEQLEKKSEVINHLERRITEMNREMSELEKQLSTANQSNIGKIDKSLIKNLVIGYITSPQADRRSIVLRIMASELDFNQDERNKVGVDNANSGWFSNLLHPKSDHAQSTQSLSEAFIRFLENESRPQPQLKLIPEQMEKNGAGATPPKSLLLSELVLPTFNSSQSSKSSSILKNVLQDS